MAIERGMTGKAAERYAWNHAYQELWCDFGCCYYSCKGLLFNAIAEDDVYEIYERRYRYAKAHEKDIGLLESETSTH